MSSDFQHPEFLALRPGLAVLALLHLLLFVQQWLAQRRAFSAEASARFGPALSLVRGLLKTALWAAGGWALLTALAVPLGPAVKIEGQSRGADVIFCVDVSSSMLAQDIQPDRLTALKAGLGELLGLLDGDRVGIVAFAGEAVVACPLTTDLDTAGLFLDKLDVDSVPRDGTGLAPALKTALDSFGEGGERGRLIVLATDGEDTAQSQVMEQARRAADKGVPVFTLGIGTPGGALIPGRRDIFGRVYAKTWRGQPVRTRLDSQTLRRIAAITGGEYVEIGDRGGLQRAAARVRQLKQGLAKAQDRFVREPLYEKPLVVAFFLLLVESLLSARAGGWRAWGPALRRGFRRWWHPKASASLLVLALLPALLGAGSRRDYNLGNAAYRRGDYAGASEAWRRSLEGANALEQAAAHYNLGNAAFMQKDWDAAINAYEEALRLTPEDEDIKHNLELAKRRREEQQQNSRRQGDKGGQKQGGGRGQERSPGRERSGEPGSGSEPSPGQGRSSTSAQAGSFKRDQDPRARAAKALSQDRVQAMLNQLRLDQKRYSGAFNPLKKFERPERQPQDPMEQILEQMGLRPKPLPQSQTEGEDVKDW